MLATAPIANGLVNFTKPQQMLATLQSIAKIKSHHPGQRFSYQWASLNCLDTSQVTMFGTWSKDSCSTLNTTATTMKQTLKTTSLAFPPVPHTPNLYAPVPHTPSCIIIVGRRWPSYILIIVFHIHIYIYEWCIHIYIYIYIYIYNIMYISFI